jgi:hypothetical protein
MAWEKPPNESSPSEYSGNTSTSVVVSDLLDWIGILSLDLKGVLITPIGLTSKINSHTEVKYKQPLIKGEGCIVGICASRFNHSQKIYLMM